MSGNDFKCNICGYTTDAYGDYKRHVLEHTQAEKVSEKFRKASKVILDGRIG
jgi:hypothetical protein